MRCIQVRQGRTADLTTLHNTMHMYIKKTSTLKMKVVNTCMYRFYVCVGPSLMKIFSKYHYYTVWRRINVPIVSNQKVKSRRMSTKYGIHVQNSQYRVIGRFSRYFFMFGMLPTFCLCVWSCGKFSMRSG